MDAAPPSTDAPRWSPWERLPLAHRFTDASLRETLDGGQAFRWRSTTEGAWRGIFGPHAVELRLAPGAELEFRAATTPGAARTALLDYLGQAAALDQWLERLPLRSDPVLATAVAACPGLILLRQPFPETLLAFILSSTKQIPQIRQLCENLARRFGRTLAPGLHALPTWPELAGVPETELRACRLGFRARYVRECAEFLAARPGWLEEVEHAPYAQARDSLCQLSGVGEKIADCALLFGAGRLEAFPVDVWILRALANRYGLADWQPAQVARFGRVHFGAGAGLAQQYLFAHERSRRR